MELKKNQEIRNGIIYNKDTNTKVGQCDFTKVQVDTLSYVPLSKKVLSILNGNMDFHADDTVNTEFDEPEQENWEKLDEDSVEIDCVDEYADASDIHDMKKSLIEKFENSKVEVTKVEEGVDTSAEAQVVENTTKEEKTE